MQYGQKMFQRWRSLLEQIESIAHKSGRKSEDITLVAVSKLHPVEAISALSSAGQVDFGENYVQEALEKQAGLGNAHIRWHFIGRMQTNKAKHLAGNFHLIHSLDSIKMAGALNKKCMEHGTVQPVLVQVNLAGEEQKGGVEYRGLGEFFQEALKLKNLQFQGLMCMPPFFSDQELARPYFAKLRQCRLEIEKEFGLLLPHLSMGMSGDYIAAIQEGSTLLRIGTTIFGSRG